MVQTWTENDESPGGTTVKQGMINLEDKLDTLRSEFSGTAFPTDTDRVVGQACWRTDAGETQGVGLYRLKTKDADPNNDVWVFCDPDDDMTVFGASLRTLADAAAARTLIGVGTAGVLTAGTGSGDVQTNSQNAAQFASRANNLSDLASAATARTNLGLGALATAASVGTAQIGAAAVTRDKLESPERSYAITSQAGTYTANEMEYVNCTLGVADSWQLDLPASPTTNAKILVRIASIGAGSVLTIDGNGEDIGQTGSTSIKLYGVDEIVELQYSGSLWVFLQKNIRPHVCEISSSGFTSPNSNSWNNVELDTVEVDTASMENVASYAIDVQRSGNYRVQISGWLGQIGPARHFFRVMKDGIRLTPQLVSDNVGDLYPSGEHDATLRGCQFDFVYPLVAGEQLTLQMYGTLDTSAENEVRLRLEEIQ